MPKHTFCLKALFLFCLTLIPMTVYAGGEPEVIDPSLLEGEIVYLEGEAALNGIQAEVGAVVRPGDIVTTGADSAMEITFGPKNIIRFQSGTESTIDPSWSGVSLKQGTVAAVLQGLVTLGFNDENRFKVRTDTAVLAVRGTSFFVDHQDQDEAYFCTCNGKLHLETVDGLLPEDTEAYHHDAIWYVRTVDGIRAFPSGLHYHDDETLDSIAERAGTSIFWRD